MTYEEACERLSQALVFGIEPLLEDIEAMCEVLGRPQDTYSCIQITGTNGKSSTARMTAALLHAYGYKVGLFTSPELVDQTERFELDGVPISRECFAHILEEAFAAGAEAHARGLAKNPITHFEYVTAAACKLFEEEQVDFAVFEVGMGGRWDATSVVAPRVSCITGVGLDHTRILGDTLEKIAGEKAAIIKPGSKVVLGPGTDETLPVFLERCEEVGIDEVIAVCGKTDAGGSEDPTHAADAYTSEGTVRIRPVPYPPDILARLEIDAPFYQAPNVACALAICEQALGHPLDDAAIARASHSVCFPGRFDTLCETPVLIIDAAHNPQGASVLARAICDRFGDLKPLLLLAVLADKDAEGIVKALSPVVGEIRVTRTSSDRALSTEELSKLVERITGSKPISYATPAMALEELLHGDTPIVAAGSITLAGEVAAYVRTTISS